MRDSEFSNDFEIIIDYRACNICIKTNAKPNYRQVFIEIPQMLSADVFIWKMFYVAETYMFIYSIYTVVIHKNRYTQRTCIYRSD